jgi:hypothetical protein
MANHEFEGHPQAAVMAVAGRAADFILDRALLHTGSLEEALAPA